MDVPIRIDGEVTGKVEITSEGNYTLFSGRCADPGRLLRLSVYGGGQEGYIGVMMPEGGVVTVKKRFTRAALRSFPAAIEYAGEAGMAASPAASAPAEAAPGDREAAACPEDTATEPCVGEAATEPCPGAAEAPGDGAAESAPGDEEEEEDAGAGGGEPPGGGELLWYETGDGSLYTRWEGRVYVAIPLGGQKMPIRNMLEQRRIEGRNYAVFAAD